MTRSLMEYAVHWEPAPPYPEYSQTLYSREEADGMLRASALAGRVVHRRVTYEDWKS